MYPNKVVRRLLSAVVGLALPLVGCAAEGTGSELEIEGTEAALAAKTVKLSPASGDFTVQVTASGTGCPTKESWDATLAPDGTSLQVRFGYYELFMDDTQDRLSLNCTLGLKFNTKRKQAVEVETVSYTGYAYLPAGVTATQKVDYTFGAKTEAGSSTTTIAGPFDDDYAISDTLSASRTKSSKCGVDHKLTADTALTLVNGTPRVYGAYINTRDLTGDATLGVRLKWKTCN